MKKILLVFLFSLMAISLVLGAQGDVVSINQGGDNLPVVTGSDTIQAGQGTGNGTQSNIETQTQNQGAETNLQNQVQVRVQSGNYENSNGEQMQIQTQTEEGTKLRVGSVEAHSLMEMTQEQTQGGLSLHVSLSNGKNAEVKIMPNTASEKAIERLQLKSCTSEEGCSIELKEVGKGEQVKATYEVQAQKEARFLGMFKTRMKVQAQIDAETGEIIQAKKPWWAFLASE